jgi:hypothetical protein
MALALALTLAGIPGSTQTAPAKEEWRFAVSGDSRDCGDVVMPGIAAGVLKDAPAFYWHLGDFRKIYDFDEDLMHDPEYRNRPVTIVEYEQAAWPDFLKNQITPFGDLPVFLGIGNHETIPPKTRDAYLTQFADWLEAPVLRTQRLADKPDDHLLRTYYHWVDRGVDFINLDNASDDQFDNTQVAWIEALLARDAADPSLHAIVVGMHKALPDSISASHSMNESATGMESGRRVYRNLLGVQKEAHKHVYLLASHSHLYMDGIFQTEFWKNNGGVLPGWIVGTAGAVRYPLPPDSAQAKTAETGVYGYILGIVQPDGQIEFQFRRLNEREIPASVVNRYTPDFVHWCFAENSTAP